MAAMRLPDDDWLLLLPAGETIVGFDGRTVRSPGAEAFARTLNADRNRDYPVDENHRSLAATSAPAVGWIGVVEVRGEEVYGHVEWLPTGREMIDSKSYRYHSPVYMQQADGTAVDLHSIGLVNSPNLVGVPALQSAVGGTMDNAAVARELGLTESASEEQILAALRKRKEPNAADLVPRADYDLVARNLESVQKEIRTLRTEGHAAKAEAAVDRAIVDEKIVPSSKAYHLQACSTAEGLAAFEAWMQKAPAMNLSQAEVPSGQPPGSEEQISPERKAIRRQFGMGSRARRQAKGENALADAFATVADALRGSR